MTELEEREHLSKYLQKLVNEAIDQHDKEAIAKYEKESREDAEKPKKTVRNKNPDNYIDFAEELNKTSHQLPELDPEKFGQKKDGWINHESRFRISTTQIRDAWVGKVENPKDHFYESLHWYLYKMPSRKVTPVMPNHGNYPTSGESQNKINASEKEVEVALLKKRFKASVTAFIAFAIALVVFGFSWTNANNRYADVKEQLDSTKTRFDLMRQDMRLLPYQPSPAQIARLEGVYMIYTASPQARKSDPDRYHKVVPNILVVNYKKEGYFTFNRYGHDFDQEGYMQFEDSNLVSMHSYMIGDYGKRSPKKTLIPFENSKDTFSVISSSWSFDPNAEDNISIGIREVFIKIGKPGSITQIVNSPRNFGKAGKLFDLRKENGEIETIYIENIRLETLPPSVQPLLNEKSILLNDPDPTVILEKPGPNRKP